MNLRRLHGVEKLVLFRISSTERSCKMRLVKILALLILWFGAGGLGYGQVEDVTCLKIDGETSCYQEYGNRPGDHTGDLVICGIHECSVSPGEQLPDPCPAIHRQSEWTTYVASGLWNVALVKFKSPVMGESGKLYRHQTGWSCTTKKKCGLFCLEYEARIGLSLPAGYYCDEIVVGGDSIPLYSSYPGDGQHWDCPGMGGPM